MKNISSLKTLAAKDKGELYFILTLTILSWLIPDALPFIDEIFLAYSSFIKLRELYEKNRQKKVA